MLSPSGSAEPKKESRGETLLSLMLSASESLSRSGFQAVAVRFKYLLANGFSHAASGFEDCFLRASGFRKVKRRDYVLVAPRVEFDHEACLLFGHCLCLSPALINCGLLLVCSPRKEASSRVPFGAEVSLPAYGAGGGRQHPLREALDAKGWLLSFKDREQDRFLCLVLCPVFV